MFWKISERHQLAVKLCFKTKLHTNLLLWNKKVILNIESVAEQINSFSPCKRDIRCTTKTLIHSTTRYDDNPSANSVEGKSFEFANCSRNLMQQASHCKDIVNRSQREYADLVKRPLHNSQVQQRSAISDQGKRRNQDQKAPWSRLELMISTAIIFKGSLFFYQTFVGLLRVQIISSSHSHSWVCHSLQRGIILF